LIGMGWCGWSLSWSQRAQVVRDTIDPSTTATATSGTAWDDARRIEAWAGELRVNLIRLLAIVLFYARHLADYLIAPVDAAVRGVYHARVTTLAVAWAVMAIALHVVLSRRRYPDSLKLFVVAFDAAMVTAICVVGGPRAPLVMLYFLVIATAALRLSLRTVYTATAASMIGYLMQLAHYAWYVVGYDKYYATPDLRIPRTHQAMVLLCMLIAGLVAGQVVRQTRRLVTARPVMVVTGEGV
jgi:hypothetical protein